MIQNSIRCALSDRPKEVDGKDYDKDRKFEVEGHLWWPSARARPGSVDSTPGKLSSIQMFDIRSNHGLFDVDPGDEEDDGTDEGASSTPVLGKSNFIGQGAT